MSAKTDCRRRPHRVAAASPSRGMTGDTILHRLLHDNNGSDLTEAWSLLPSVEYQ